MTRLTIRKALHNAQQKVDPTDARLLLQALLNVDHVYLITHDDETLSAAQQTHYAHWLTRATTGEPIPYIVGRAPFFGRSFKTTPDVLIPRPETELLVEEALRWGQAHHAQNIIDVGTGSGCIPITLALEWQDSPKPTITAVDISPAALTIAQENAHTHNAPVTFHHSDLLTAVHGPFNLITANLPYITDAEWTELDDGVKSYEPALALRGGRDGLDLIRPLLQQATNKIAPHTLILLEIGWQQGKNALQTAADIFPTAHITLLKDYANHDRIIRIEHHSEHQSHHPHQ